MVILVELIGLIYVVRSMEVGSGRVIVSGAIQASFLSSFSRDRLIRLKLRALKSGVWFRVLRDVERALVDLTIRIVDRPRSPALIKSLLSVMGKLMDARETKVDVAVKEVGLFYARRLSLLAQKWGNKSAPWWMYDLSFARFIAVMHMNSMPKRFSNC
jgi:hypothetical protein